MQRFWVLLFLNSFVMTATALGWGNRGHEMIADLGNGLVSEAVFQNCHVSPVQLVEHSTDPDLKWRKDVRRHPNESHAHFFHVDKQPENWRTLKSPASLEEGFLVFRILEWTDKAKEQRKNENWAELSETLFGLVHYLGDLTMPLHLNSLHEGEEVGLPGLHSQWESKMVFRYEEELKKMVRASLSKEAIPPLWKPLETPTLIFNIAEQSYKKSERVFSLARESLILPHLSPKAKKRAERIKKMGLRFSKQKLFESLGPLTQEQLALGARLWARTLTEICQ